MPKAEIRILVVEDNVLNARMQESMLTRAEDRTFRISRADSLLSALDLITKQQFDIAMVDLTLPDSQGIETFLTIQRHAPNLPIIVVSGNEDEAVALNAVRLGAQDYLSKSKLDQDGLLHSLSYALARTRESPARNGVVATKASFLALMGAKGGVGTTTLACHCVLELAAQTGEKSLLAGLDISSGVVSLLMKVNAPYTLADAAMNLHRLDEDLWRGIAVSAGDGIDLLQAPALSRIEVPVVAERTRHVLRFAQMQYRWIVADLGRLTASTFTVLEDVTELFVIATPDLLGLHEAGRVLKAIAESGFGLEKTKLVINRQARVGIPAADIEKALGYPVYMIIPDFTDDLQDAYPQGRFTDPKLKLRKEVGKMIRRWRGVEEKPPITHGFRLFHRDR